MLLFAAACGTSRAVVDRVAEAVRRVAAAVPNLDGDLVATRASASGVTVVAVVSHSSEVAAPRRYLVDRPDEMLFFDGLPVGPEGSVVLDAEQLFRTSELSGAGTGLRISFLRDRIELITGVLGGPSTYVAAAPGGGHVVSNSTHALRWLLNLRDPEPLGLSSFLTLGWAVSDRTLTAGIRVLPGGSRILIDRDRMRVDDVFGRHAVEQQLARSEVPRPGLLAEQLTESIAGLSVFGSGVRCALTAGRDSRLCLALLRAAGVDATYYTLGAPGDPDVDVALALARRFGLAHEVVSARSLMDADCHTLARTFVLQNDGLRSFEQIADQTDVDLPITSLGVKVSGLGGEVARFGTTPLNALAANVRPLAGLPAFQRRVLVSKLDATEALASVRAVSETRDYINSFMAARRAEGGNTSQSGLAFFVCERVRRWAATGVRQAAPTADLYTPFADKRFIEPALASSPDRQFAESLHFELLTALGTDLRDFPFQYSWRRQSSRFVGPRAIAMAGGVLADRFRKSGHGPAALRPTPGSSAPDWVAATADVHLPVVARANASALGSFIDLDRLHRALETRSRLGSGGLRALTAVWWFDVGSGGVFDLGS